MNRKIVIKKMSRVKIPQANRISVNVIDVKGKTITNKPIMKQQLDLMNDKKYKNFIELLK